MPIDDNKVQASIDAEVGMTTMEVMSESRNVSNEDNKFKQDEGLLQANSLHSIEPEEIKSLGKEGEWEVIDFAVDSGATETVINEDMISSVAVLEGPASKRGVKYEVANGDRIPNIGEKKFTSYSEEGKKRNITAQVCDVNKALLSVKKVVAAGNRVIFDDEGSYIEDKKTKEKMWIKEENGMYILRLWVKNEDFHRQSK